MPKKFDEMDIFLEIEKKKPTKSHSKRNNLNSLIFIKKLIV